MVRATAASQGNLLAAEEWSGLRRDGKFTSRVLTGLVIGALRLLGLVHRPGAATYRGLVAEAAVWRCP
jgi:hypothetical protein